MSCDETSAPRVLREGKTLRSPRLVLEPFSLDFVTDAYIGWMNDPEIRKGLVSNQGRDTTRSDLEQYVRSLGPDTLQFAILREGRHIGNIKIYDWQPHHRRMEVGYLIGERALSGKGFATEAVGRVVEFCFDEVLLHKVTSGCFVGNEASARVLVKNGFAPEGTLRDHFWIQGEFIDVLRFGKIAG